MLKRTGLLLAAATVALSAGAASADSYYYRHHRHHHHHRYYNDRYEDGRSNAIFSIAIGDIAFGYRDGYWDNGHRWHRWAHNNDYDHYRSDGGDRFHDWNHDRDNDNGWQRR